jgi:UDP-GlcNAc:undecaprenyl-phosphate GlcNAc-1-phosphate transferase
MASGFRVALLDGVLGGGWPALAASALLTLVWVVGVMNAVNLIDGKDGVAAGVAALAFVGLAGAHALRGDAGGLLLVAAVLGSLLAFLRYNFHPATIFMGDSGSLFVGYLLAAYALRGTAHPDPVLALVVPCVAMGLPILDTLVSMGRRRLRGRPLFFPDRDHIHHRVGARLPYRKAVFALWAVGAYFAAGAMAMAAAPTPVAVAVFAAGTAGVAAFLRLLGYLRRPAAETLPRLPGRAAGVALPVGGDGALVETGPPEPTAPFRRRPEPEPRA